MSYDVALHLDFDDQAGMDDYNDDDVHHEVAVYNASICRGELTARVDWWYDGEPLIAKDQVKHSAPCSYGPTRPTTTAKEGTHCDTIRALERRRACSR